jgi:uroporphyrinogen-III decarboxylase
MLTLRENFLRVIKGLEPEYLSEYSLWWGMASPPFFWPAPSEDGVFRDLFGVEYVRDSSGIVGSAMPKTHDFILEDITKWRDVIKLPNPADITDSAWADAAKQARDRANPDLPFAGGTSMGFFQPLVGIMGFTEGLSACFEQPEEVKDLLNYLCDYSVAMAKKYVYYYQPDYGTLGDDIAHERNPFVSLEMFRDIFGPVWRRYYDVFTEVGIPVGHHNCGYFEPLLEDLVSMGVTFWDPVQSTNDSLGIKAKYGRGLVMCQGYDVRFIKDDATEEEVRGEFRDYISKVAVGGGYAFARGGIENMVANREIEKKFMQWIYDEYDEIKTIYY